MKLLTAVVRPHELDTVRQVLERHAVLGMTLTEIRRTGADAVHWELQRGAPVPVGLAPALRIESVVHDELVDRLLDGLTAGLGDGSDARLLVRAVDQVERVRTGERGADAV